MHKNIICYVLSWLLLLNNLAPNDSLSEWRGKDNYTHTHTYTHAHARTRTLKCANISINDTIFKNKRKYISITNSSAIGIYLHPFWTNCEKIQFYIPSYLSLFIYLSIRYVLSLSHWRKKQLYIEIISDPDLSNNRPREIENDWMMNRVCVPVCVCVCLFVCLCVSVCVCVCLFVIEREIF